MKYAVIILILFLAGCATQQSPQQVYKVKETPKVQTPVISTKSEAPQKEAVLLEEEPKQLPQVKIKKPAPKPTPPQTFENLKGVYSCTLAFAYKTSTASSIDTKGGTLRMTINENDTVLQSSSAVISGINTLKLRSKSGRGITAVSDTMVFSYNRNSQDFTLSAGIGNSGFNLASGGHTGNQMLISGTCTKQ
ncbi:MAG: hypothetical protein COA46_00785 [Porticoccaceae bacterium]|nr:MAG: hypothetical protein COA46_00785 [Porticoccaceae bacterium]